MAENSLYGANQMAKPVIQHFWFTRQRASAPSEWYVAHNSKGGGTSVDSKGIPFDSQNGPNVIMGPMSEEVATDVAWSLNTAYAMGKEGC